MRRFAWLLSVVLFLLMLAGCTLNEIAVGNDGLRVRAGEWVGQNDTGNFLLQFKVVRAGSAAQLLLLDHSYPCGQESLSIRTYQMWELDHPGPIARAEVQDGTFRVEVDPVAFMGEQTSPKVIIAGRFIDSAHAEGTWEVSGLWIDYADIACPAAKGTWQGRPQ